MGLKWRNAGQACISANRVYVQSGIYETFAAMIKERTSKLVIGHGSSQSTTIGPVTTPQSLERALGQVEDARKHGARILLGGERVAGQPGYFFHPTIVADATKDMRVADEETFGPILSIFKFESEIEAVQAANDTPVRVPILNYKSHANWLIKDGTGLVLFHQKLGQSLEAHGESRGWHDWSEHE